MMGPSMDCGKTGSIGCSCNLGVAPPDCYMFRLGDPSLLKLRRWPLLLGGGHSPGTRLAIQIEVARGQNAQDTSRNPSVERNSPTKLSSTLCFNKGQRANHTSARLCVCVSFIPKMNIDF